MKKTVIYSFQHSLPILIGFLPVGIAYGLLMQNAGYNFLWSGVASIFVFAGSLQFLMVSFLTSGVSLVTVAFMALLLNSRHIFYGLPFLEKFRAFGLWKYFLAFSLTDENFSLHCANKPGEGVSEKWSYILTAAFTWCYWVTASVLGGVLGSVLTFDTTGIDFAMTALFIVILVDQLREGSSRLPALAAAAASLVCIFAFGADNFILPALCLTIAMLIVLRKTIEKAPAEKAVVSQ